MPARGDFLQLMDPWGWHFNCNECFRHDEDWVSRNGVMVFDRESQICHLFLHLFGSLIFTRIIGQILIVSFPAFSRQNLRFFLPFHVGKRKSYCSPFGCVSRCRVTCVFDIGRLHLSCRRTEYRGLGSWPWTLWNLVCCGYFLFLWNDRVIEGQL